MNESFWVLQRNLISRVSRYVIDPVGTAQEIWERNLLATAGGLLMGTALQAASTYQKGDQGTNREEGGYAYSEMC